MCWEASYKTLDGGHVSIPETATNHCPVSLLSTEKLGLRDTSSLDYVMQFARARIMKDVGAVPYGGDLNKWPAKLADAFVILQTEHSRAESIQHTHSASPKPQQKSPGLRRVK